MNKQTRWLVVIIPVVAVIVAIMFSKKPSDQTQSSINQPQIRQNKTNDGTSPSAHGPSELIGKLQETDDIERGNLLLVTSDKRIYLNTTRDFNSLVGKDVKVLIEGTADDFRLLDIVDK